jgi:hypothetical protein
MTMAANSSLPGSCGTGAALVLTALLRRRGQCQSAGLGPASSAVPGPGRPIRGSPGPDASGRHEAARSPCAAADRGRVGVMSFGRGGDGAILTRVAALFPMQVGRFAVPEGTDAGFFLDDQGMLAAAGSAGRGERGLTDIRALTSAGSFSLLAEQGVGKTTALESLISGIPELDAAEPGQDAVLAVSLTEITDRAAFADLITRPVAARIPAGQEEPEGCLTLVLDGLDQCPLGARAFAGLLREMLKKTDTRALRVLIGCRSAGYPPVVHKLLARALGSFTSYELAPLSRADIRDLAASRGV